MHYLWRGIRVVPFKTIQTTVSVFTASGVGGFIGQRWPIDINGIGVTISRQARSAPLWGTSSASGSLVVNNDNDGNANDNNGLFCFWGFVP